MLHTDAHAAITALVAERKAQRPQGDPEEMAAAARAAVHRKEPFSWGECLGWELALLRHRALVRPEEPLVGLLVADAFAHVYCLVSRIEGPYLIARAMCPCGAAFFYPLTTKLPSAFCSDDDPTTVFANTPGNGLVAQIVVRIDLEDAATRRYGLTYVLDTTRGARAAYEQ